MKIAGRPPILNPAARDTTIRSHDDRIMAALPVHSRVNLHKLTADTLEIGPVDTGEGDSLLRLLFRPAFDGSFTVYPEVLDVSGGGTVSLLATGLGGLVDSVALTASTDYNIWAFASGNSDLEFQGYGITRRPQITVADTISGGAPGSRTVFTVPGGESWQFTEESRVIVRQSTAINAAYNQGTIVSTGAGTLEIDLDPDYALTEQNNASLVGLIGLEIIQTDGFQPKYVDAGAATDPGVFGGYQYSYLGMLQTDVSSNIRWTRRPGEWYSLASRAQIVLDSPLLAPVTAYVGCGRAVPVGVRDLWISDRIEMVANQVHMELYAGYDPATQYIYQHSGFAHTSSLAGHAYLHAGEVGLRELTGSIYTDRNLNHGECILTMHIERYQPIDW